MTSTPFLADRSRVVRVVAAAVFALVLGWLVASRTYVAHLALSGFPTAAVDIAARDPLALAARAIDDYDAAFPPPSVKGEASSARPVDLDKRQVRDQLVEALRASPLDPRLLRRLGQMEHDGGKPEKAEALMREAVRQSRQETLAFIALMQAAYGRGDFRGVADYADVLLRTRASAVTFAYTVFGRLSDDPATRAEVVRHLASDPPWRKEFFRTIANHVGDPRSIHEVMARLKSTAAPPRESEMSAYLAFLVKHGFYDLAYYSWLDFLTPERLAKVALLNDGSFELVPSQSPFDWAISSGAGAVVEIVEHPQAIGRKVLQITFNFGRVEFRGVSQMVMLGAGRYRLSGRYRGELKGRRGLEWHVACAGAGGKRLGQSAMFTGVAREWAAFDVLFEVRPTECAAQSVNLILAARSASEQLVTGEVLYDDLRIEAVRAQPQ